MGVGSGRVTAGLRFLLTLGFLLILVFDKEWEWGSEVEVDF